MHNVISKMKQDKGIVTIKRNLKRKLFVLICCAQNANLAVT